jgi:hypothetical protein
VVFSPDGRRVAYTVVNLMDWSQVVIDGKPSPKYDSGLGEVLFSPDSRHVVYSVLGDNHGFVVVDGVEGPKYDAVGDAVYSADGQHLAYLAKKGRTPGVVEGGTWRVVEDGVEGLEGAMGPAWNIAPAPNLSADGRRVAFPAERDGKPLADLVEGVKWVEVVDGVAGPEYDEVGDAVFSPDGKRVAYSPKKGEKWLIVLDGVEEARYDVVGDAVFSPDSRHVAYTANHSKRRVVVVEDGVEGPEYDLVVRDGPNFLADGTLVYLATKGGSLYRVRNIPK